MKAQLFLLTCFGFNISSALYAQNTQLLEIPNTVLIQGKNHVQWRGLVTANYHQPISNIKPGFVVEATINKAFIIGAFGQFTTGNFAIPYKGYQNNIITQDFGLLLGVTQNPNNKFYLGGQLRAGAILMQGDSTVEIKILKPVKPTAKDHGMTVYLEVNGNVNLSKHLKLRLGTGYNFLLMKKETVINERDLDGWFLSTALVVPFRW